MYTIVKGLAKPPVITKPGKICDSCGENFSLNSIYMHCKECRRRFWLESELARGRSPEDLKLKANRCISSLERDQLLEDLEGRCAICQIPQEQCSRNFALDHCHRTGRIRALLCGNCNTGLGMFKDDPQLMNAGAAYLEKYPIA